jgi:phosphatidylserine decarboxylase
MSHDRYIVRQGLPFILPLGILTGIFFITGPVWVAVLFLLFTFFVTWFFRNPQRITPDDEKAVISPADGKIIKIEEIPDSDILKGPSKVISVFMNVFNVHVNRIPYSGTVDAIRYDKGKFFSANLDKASKLNERNMVFITSDDGRRFLTVQIAGLIARRIVCWLEEGTHVKKGDRFGLIRFGSRLDVYLPADSTIAVRIGDKVRAGETTIGWMK